MDLLPVMVTHNRIIQMVESQFQGKEKDECKQDPFSVLLQERKKSLEVQLLLVFHAIKPPGTENHKVYKGYSFRSAEAIRPFLGFLQCCRRSRYISVLLDWGT
jgi:hypothetical protein